MPRLRRDGYIPDPRKTPRADRSHSLNFQGIESSQLSVLQDSSYCSAYHLLPVDTKNSRPSDGSNAKECPTCFTDFSIQCIAVQVRGDFPARHARLAFECKIRRQHSIFPDQDRTGFDLMVHCAFSSYGCSRSGKLASQRCLAAGKLRPASESFDDRVCRG